jgi:hypothetical protein
LTDAGANLWAPNATDYNGPQRARAEVMLSTWVTINAKPDHVDDFKQASLVHLTITTPSTQHAAPGGL